VLMGLFSAELYELWRACYRFGRELYGRSSKVIVSIAGKDFFLI